MTLSRSLDRLAGELAASRRGTHAASSSLCGPFALLLGRHLRFDAADPLWSDRDRLVLPPEMAGLGTAASTLLCAASELFHVSGQVLGTAVGLALAERMLAARFGGSLVDHRCWALCRGEDLASGPIQEAASLAGQWRLGRLSVLASVSGPDVPGLAGFAAHGWSVRRARACDQGEVSAAFSAALRSVKPTLIACLSDANGREAVPGRPDGERAEGGEPGLQEAACWAVAGRRGAGPRRAWLKRLARHALRPDFEQAIHGQLGAGWHEPLSQPAWLTAGQAISTRRAVHLALAKLSPRLPSMALPAEAPCPAPHVASSALAGLALHGGLLPVGARPLGALDRVRPALVDAAQAGRQLVQLLVEPPSPCAVAGHRSGLRGMRNLAVFRPADAFEALECLELALRRATGPSVLLLSDQEVALLPERPGRARLARGAYLVERPPGLRDVTLVASGPELHVALAVRTLLAARRVEAAVVSLPCWTLFGAQPAEWRASVLGSAPRVGVEAGSGFGWERWLGEGGLFISLAPGPGSAGSAGPEADTRLVVAMVLRHLASAAT